LTSAATRAAKWAAGIAALALVLAALRIAGAFVSMIPKPTPPVATHGGDVFGDPLPQGAVARFGTIRCRGQGPAIWAEGGEHLFVGMWNGEIGAMNARTGLVDWTLPGHSTPFVRPLDLFDVNEIGRVLRTGALSLEHDAICGLALFPDGKRLLSSGYSIRTWDLATRAETARIPLRGGTIHDPRISPDGTK